MLEQFTKKRDEQGFTLIELLIVIVILGILAAVVVFAVGGITNHGDLAACQSDVKTMEVAAEAYYAQNGASAAQVYLSTDLPHSLVPGFMHLTSSIGLDVQNGKDYTVTFTPGTAGTATPAGTVTAAPGTGAPFTTCP